MSDRNAQFVDDDWLAANDLLPLTPPLSAPPSPESTPADRGDGYGKATIRDLRLKPVTSISATSPCGEAIETMRDKGFDQLPVSSGPSRLVGLVTLGNLLSYLSSGRASADSPVSDVMFDFTKMSEVVTNPHLIDIKTPEEKREKRTTSESESHPKRKGFVEITRDTKLAALSSFFEWNSAAIVTERAQDEKKELKAVAVVTKVDLLTWLVKHGKTKQNGST